jgi:hypothetical protein
VAKVDLISAAGIAAGLPEGFRARCPRCRYDLSGLDDGLCPECGRPFSLRELLAAWHAERARPRGGAAFAFGVILTVIASPPADVRSPAALAWKVVVLSLLWTAAWMWTKQKREEHEQEGYKLLWLWAPCLSTAMALANTPVVGRVNGVLMLAIASAVAWRAYRRTPGVTTAIVTAVLSIPVAAAVFFGMSLLTAGLDGRASGDHWSFADYPGWYWRGVRGRSRGISNPDAVRIGAWMIAGAALAVLGLVPLWLQAARLLRRTGRG